MRLPWGPQETEAHKLQSARAPVYVRMIGCAKASEKLEAVGCLIAGPSEDVIGERRPLPLANA
ncbi:hypothetical protein [Rhizobium aegyptiacum]|uniref:hypothetical protein n=1 Tax=Rhizobium aegyptiacum TaxID=1764550 RepID=UPI0007E58710|nr:hypothetical protein [Rhizobium aegyptiacum]